jgi:hypothetical protein
MLAEENRDVCQEGTISFAYFIWRDEMRDLKYGCLLGEDLQQ